MGWISLIFEPLVILGVILVIIVIVNKCNVNTKYVFRILYLLIVFFIFVTTPLGANYLISSIEIKHLDLHCKNIGIKTIVILGGGVTGNPVSNSDIWRLKEASYRRTLAGLELANSIENSTIIVSGGHGGRIKEADLMKNLINKIGFTGKIVKDGDSLNTYKSSVNVTKILMKNEIVKYWLVSSSTHMSRAGSVFKKQGLLPCRYPVNSKYVDTKFPASLLPQISALNKSTTVFHELLGYLWYFLSGKI